MVNHLIWIRWYFRRKLATCRSVALSMATYQKRTTQHYADLNTESFERMWIVDAIKTSTHHNHTLLYAVRCHCLAYMICNFIFLFLFLFRLKNGSMFHQILWIHVNKSPIRIGMLQYKFRFSPKANSIDIKFAYSPKNELYIMHAPRRMKQKDPSFILFYSLHWPPLKVILRKFAGYLCVCKLEVVRRWGQEKIGISNEIGYSSVKRSAKLNHSCVPTYLK